MFWFNLKKSGDGDYSTRHAACPVLAGTKWGMRISYLFLLDGKGIGVGQVRKEGFSVVIFLISGFLAILLDHDNELLKDYRPKCCNTCFLLRFGT